MAKLIYSALTSLDLYVADKHGNFDWAAPDAEVHTFVNDLLRPVGTHLYGRRMYEVLVAWESPDIEIGEPPLIADFASIWRGADKIVFSRSLESVSSARTRIERDFNPEAIREMKATADRDISIGGPDLAAQATRGRPRRRDPPVPEPDHCRWRQSGAPGRHSRPARTARRAPVREWRGLPALPSNRLRRNHGR